MAATCLKEVCLCKKKHHKLCSQTMISGSVPEPTQCLHDRIMSVVQWDFSKFSVSSDGILFHCWWQFVDSLFADCWIFALFFFFTSESLCLSKVLSLYRFMLLTCCQLARVVATFSSSCFLLAPLTMYWLCMTVFHGKLFRIGAVNIRWWF